MSLQIAGDGLGRGAGLMNQRRERRQRVAEQAGDNLIMGAAEDRAVWGAADPPRQGHHVFADRLAQPEGTFKPFNRMGPFMLAYGRPESGRN